MMFKARILVPKGTKRSYKPPTFHFFQSYSTSYFFLLVCCDHCIRVYKHVINRTVPSQCILKVCIFNCRFSQAVGFCHVRGCSAFGNL